MNVIFDLFPARAVVLPDGADLTYFNNSPDTFGYADAPHVQHSRRVEAVRIILTENTIMIGADSSTGPVLIFREKYLSDSRVLDRKGKKPSRIITETNKIIIFDKDDNCGCGSRLRAWNPYRTMNSTKDPIE